VILDFQAKQDKLELYSTLTLVFYLSYHFNGKSNIFILKTDYFPYFEYKMLGYLAILFRRYGSLFQVASNCPKTTASIRQTEHNRDMIYDSIILLILNESN